jgi:hypothetical protein
VKPSRPLLWIAAGLLLALAALVWLGRNAEPPSRIEAAPTALERIPQIETQAAVSAAPPLFEEPEDPPLERLTQLPEGFTLPEDDRLPNPDQVPVVPVASLPEGSGGVWPDVSVEGRTERYQGRPGEERELRGGVTVSPEDAPGDASLIIEGGVREEYSGREEEPTKRNSYGGLRIKVPLPAVPDP